MTRNELNSKVNELYQNNFDTMLKGFRDNTDQDEISYDIEEVYEDTQSFGDLIDFFIEKEKCTEWDAPCGVEGSKARQVLVADFVALDQLLANEKNT